MHILAGILLVAEFALIWFVDRSVDVAGLEILAGVLWLVAAPLCFLPMAVLRRLGGVRSGNSYVHTEVLVDTGLYALVRHPQYLGWMLMYGVVVLFNPNWIVALLGLAGAVCVYVFTVEEEANLVTKFGEAYERYMQSVPRFNLLAGAVRLLRRTGA